MVKVNNLLLTILGKFLDTVADGVCWIQEQPMYIKYILLTLVFIIVYVGTFVYYKTYAAVDYGNIEMVKYIPVPIFEWDW